MHGYGNGTNNVNVDSEEPYIDATGWPQRSDSTGSKGDELGGSSPESMESNDDTIDSPLDTPPIVEYYVEPPIPKDVKARREKRRDVMSMVARSVSGRVSKRRPISALFSDTKYAENVEHMVERHSSLGGKSRRHSMLPDLRRKGGLSRSATVPSRPDNEGEPYILHEDSDWAVMQTFVEREDDEMLSAWDEYAGLGGLTDMSR